jgi:hypothetical protein
MICALCGERHQRVMGRVADRPCNAAELARVSREVERLARPWTMVALMSLIDARGLRKAWRGR